MDVQPLYDWAPLLRLMLLGAVIALGPLAWVWLRNKEHSPLQRWQALTVLTLFLTFDLVMFGAFTRLTDSGLGCPDWPGCYGSASPVGARQSIAEAQAAMPTGPVTHGKAWVEMIHRYLATSVGVLIIALTVGAWRQRRAARSDARRILSTPAGATLEPLSKMPVEPLNPWWPTFTLFWVCLQGAFGAWTVTMKLQPAIVSLHLMGGLVLLILLCVQASRYTQAVTGQQHELISRGLRRGLMAVASLMTIQSLLGGWVSTNYAVLACTTFPTCQGSWWPVMNFSQGFQIWRELGFLKDGSHIDFAALTAIHYVHRLFAYLVIAATLALLWRLHRAGRLQRQTRWLAGLITLQFLTGLSNVVLDWPLVAAVLHTGGAAALLVVLTWAISSSRTASTPFSPRSTTQNAPESASRISA